MRTTDIHIATGMDILTIMDTIIITMAMLMTTRIATITLMVRTVNTSMTILTPM